MNNGDRVEWCYKHPNANQYGKGGTSTITKTGTFDKLIKHKIDWTGEQLALVYLDNNEMVAKIPISELTLQKNKFDIAG